MDRELEAKGEDRAGPSAASATAVPAQNTVGQTAGQPIPDEGSLRSRTVAFAPWVIHALWLVAGVATVGYYRNRDWGMFEAIPLMMAAVFGIAAWIDWIIAWALLARQPVIQRVAYLLVGLLANLALSDWIFEWTRNDKQVPLALGILSIGFAVPLTLVWWRGWRIVISNNPLDLPSRAASRFGQFSIGELLLLTTGAAVFISLALAQRQQYGALSWGETVSEGVIVACGTLLVVVGLAARRFVRAAIVCLLISLVIIVGAITWFNREFLLRPHEWLLTALIFGPAFVGLLASIGLARWWGYRLVQCAAPEPSG
jgi:uncharacterized membrane protein YuzA (DUF378 family)